MEKWGREWSDMEVDEVWRTGDENGPTWKRVKYGELGTRMVRHGSG